jgi:hypothetical protein
MANGFVRHLSVRVPWHDRQWDGHVCDKPSANSSCIALKLIAENKRDNIEDGLKSKAFDSIEEQALVPPCVKTSAAFLSSLPHVFESVMAYSKWSKDHEHIEPRIVEDLCRSRIMFAQTLGKASIDLAVFFLRGDPESKYLLFGEIGKSHHVDLVI